MSKLSLAGTGWAVIIIMWLLNYFGLDADEGSVTATVEAFFVVAGFVAALVGQIRRKDLSWGIVRK